MSHGSARESCRAVHHGNLNLGDEFSTPGARRDPLPLAPAGGKGSGDARQELVKPLAADHRTRGCILQKMHVAFADACFGGTGLRILEV